MRRLVPLFSALTLAFGAARAIDAQITANPIPAPVEKRGITIRIQDVVRLPETRGIRPPDQDVNPAGWARVSFVRDSPDGRRFTNDSRGFLYLLSRDNKPSLYLDFAALFPHAAYNRLESGLIGFTFHPEFAKNARQPTPPTTTSSPNGARRIPPRIRSTGRGASCSASRTSS
jgi:hypothetical protein